MTGSMICQGWRKSAGRGIIPGVPWPLGPGAARENLCEADGPLTPHSPTEPHSADDGFSLSPAILGPAGLRTCWMEWNLGFHLHPTSVDLYSSNILASSGPGGVEWAEGVELSGPVPHTSGGVAPSSVGRCRAEGREGTAPQLLLLSGRRALCQ